MKQKCLSIKTLNKSNVWDIQENDIVRMFSSAVKDTDFEDNLHHYIDIIKTAFDIEEINATPSIISKYEARGYKIGEIKFSDSKKVRMAIKKRPILRVNDLTYENIRHISAVKLLEVLDRNFGGGWDSLPQSIQDIILSGFDVSTTTLPKDKIHKEGGMYEKKIKDGFEVLNIPKGTWVEAIFAKEKPKCEKIKLDLDNTNDDTDDELNSGDEFNKDEEEDDDTFDDEKLTEESYRTSFETNSDDLNIEAEDISDDDENY